MGDPRGFMTTDRELPKRRPVDIRIRDWREVYEDFEPRDVESQAGRCMDCGIPFCHNGCPLGNLIPAVLVLAVNAEPEATVAVMVGVPEVHRVTANALVPETSAALEGSTAAESVDVIAIVWVAVDTRFQFASTALTVAESAVPAV